MSDASPCEDIFNLLHPKPNNSTCKQVTALFPQCKCEQHSVRPKKSPGVVKDEEVIVRFVPNNQDYYDSAKGLLTPKNFDLVRHHGLSVNRIGACEIDMLKKRQVEGNYLGYVEVKVADVRALRHFADGQPDQPPPDPVQIFAIYDTALDENPAHADICQAVFIETPPPKGQKSREIKFRHDLQAAFGNSIKSFVDQITPT